MEDREEDFHYASMLLLRRPLVGTYEVSWAASYEDGLREVLSNRYDVGLFDYQLGGGTGLDLLRAAQAHHCEMPIILLTGVDNAEIDHQASQAGAADYLCKSELTTTQLERAIRYARRQAIMRSELRRTSSLLNGILSSLPVAAMRVDADGLLEELRGHGVARIGLDPDELVGTHLLAGSPHPAEHVRRAVQGGDANFVWEISHRGKSYYFDNYLRFDSERGHGAIGFAVDVTARVEAETERNRQARLLQSILKNLPVIAGRLDAAGRVTEVHGSGLAHLEISAARLAGKVFSDVYPQSRPFVAEALRGGSAGFTLAGRHGEERWSVDFSMSFDADQGAGATFFGRDMTGRRQLERQLLTVSEAEQRRIGADLHDGLGQQLTGLACLAAALRDRLRAIQPSEAAQADLIARIANEATEQSRALARGLSPVQLEQHGFSSALEDLTFQAQRLHGVACRFSMRGALPEPDHHTALHLYRITQEAIHNAVRHGRAKSIRVFLVSNRQAHRLVVSDDGAGFDVDAPARVGSRGLRLMSYRATMINATLAIDSKPGAGTRIECVWTTTASSKE